MVIMMKMHMFDMRKALTAVRRLPGLPALLRRQEGIGLVEVLIAMVITGGVVVLLCNTLSTGSRAVGIMQERTIAENLARAQLEFTRSQDYIPAPASYDAVESLPADFTVSADASSVVDRDENIQRITVTVYRDGDAILTEEDFKVNR